MNLTRVPVPVPAILTVYRYMVVIDTWIYNYQRQPLLHLLTWTKLLSFLHKHQIICRFYSITWSLWALSREFYTSTCFFIFFTRFLRLMIELLLISSILFLFFFSSWILADWVYLVSSNTGDSHANITFCVMRNWPRSRCKVENNEKSHRNSKIKYKTVYSRNSQDFGEFLIF